MHRCDPVVPAQDEALGVRAHEMTPVLRVGLLCDLPEEGWPSMDLVADRLEHHLRVEHPSVAVTRLCPPFVPRVGRFFGAARGTVQPIADRLMNRHVDYPRWLRREAIERRFDLFHVVDHSYAHLVRDLPAERSLVTCHDLDAFRGVLDPLAYARPLPLRVLAGRSLAGLRAAAAVVCDSHAVRDELLLHRVVPAGRVTVVPLGAHPSRSAKPDPGADMQATALLGAPAVGTPELLHVGSTIPRKRIDRLLEVFARVLDRVPRARLVRVGGALTAPQRARAGRLGIDHRITTLPFLDQPVLSAVYRRAALAVLTSDAEGFGLPVIEALASGTPVVATDLPVLREVGGSCVSYCRAGDLEHWVATVTNLLREREQDPARWLMRQETGVLHAVGFSWGAFATEMVRLYRVLGRSAGSAAADLAAPHGDDGT